MIKKLIIIVLTFIYSVSANANSDYVKVLKQNNKLIFIRHALAPGNGDPDNFDIFDCSTQRNLNSVGTIKDY